MKNLDEFKQVILTWVKTPRKTSKEQEIRDLVGMKFIKREIPIQSKEGIQASEQEEACSKPTFSQLLDCTENAFIDLNIKIQSKSKEDSSGCFSFLYAKNKPRYTGEEKRQIKRLKNLYLGLIIAARDEASAKKSDRPAGKENNLDTLKEKAGKSELLKTNRSNVSFFQRDPTSSIRKIDKINLTRADSFIARIKNCLRFR